MRRSYEIRRSDTPRERNSMKWSSRFFWALEGGTSASIWSGLVAVGTAGLSLSGSFMLFVFIRGNHRREGRTKTVLRSVSLKNRGSGCGRVCFGQKTINQMQLIYFRPCEEGVETAL